MMSRFTRLSVYLIVLTLMVVSPALPAFAQASGDPLCNGLSQADCDLLTAAGDAMDGVDSLSIPDWSIVLSLVVQGEVIDFQTNGSAPALDFAATPTIHFVIENAVLATPDGTESGGLEFITQDNMLYVKVDDVWYGGSADEQDLAEMPEVGELGELGDLDDLGDLDLNIDLGAALSTARGADVEMMGQSMATFTTTLDPAQALTALLMDPAIGEALGMALGEAELGGEELKPEDLMLLGAFLGPMLAKSSISFAQWVGLEDSLIHKVALNVVLDLDLSFFAPELGVVIGNLAFESEIADFNATFDVAVPESYQPLEELNVEGLELEM